MAMTTPMPMPHIDACGGKCAIELQLPAQTRTQSKYLQPATCNLVLATAAASAVGLSNFEIHV